MGLLDDAIRDHLELKRLRGADPGEVAREQREALEPDLRREPGAGEEDLATAVEGHRAEGNSETLPVRATPALTPTSTTDAVRAHQPAYNEISSSVEDSANVAEETAELDMRAVLEEDRAGAGGSGDDGDAPGSGGVSPALDDLNDDQLQWDVPGDSSAEMQPDAPHNDRAAGDDDG